MTANPKPSQGPTKSPKPPKLVEIEVNGREVKLRDGVATGLVIKQASIDQSVAIQLNFVLQQELPNGSSVIIGDSEKVKLRQHLRFTAIAPDDNS
ncbi:MAG: multiubiquitin domain-containing protein [Pseudomonadota bacterium]